MKFATLSGESADVDTGVIADWKERLVTLCDGFVEEDIFNMDESGFFYRSLPSKSFVTNSDTCNGGKMSKERLTVLFCCSMKGEKTRPLIIGKSASPRCFKM